MSATFGIDPFSSILPLQGLCSLTLYPGALPQALLFGAFQTPWHGVGQRPCSYAGMPKRKRHTPHGSIDLPEPDSLLWNSMLTLPCYNSESDVKPSNPNCLK